LTPPFTGTTLDRAADLRSDRVEIERLLKHPRAVVIGASADSVLVSEGAEPSLLRRPLEGRVNPYQPILLGLEDGVPLFGADLDDPEAQVQVAETGLGRLVSLRDAGLLLSQSEGGLAAYLVALLNWHRKHKFCSVCGWRTRVAEAGLVRRCPNCKTTHFPRTDPVVIMLVEHEGHVLLGRRIGWPEGRFSILAGYVSSGETPEEAVAREVHEESGIVAFAPRYVASQPWPFPSSLMLGFDAVADGGEPRATDAELEQVHWFGLDEVQAAMREENPQLRLPPRVSIARFLVEQWVQQRPPGGPS
jgi:NAD+ diphosphatase